MITNLFFLLYSFLLFIKNKKKNKLFTPSKYTMKSVSNFKRFRGTGSNFREENFLKIISEKHVIGIQLKWKGKKKENKSIYKIVTSTLFPWIKSENEWATAHNLLWKPCFVIEIVEKTGRVNYFTDHQKKNKGRKRTKYETKQKEMESNAQLNDNPWFHNF